MDIDWYAHGGRELTSLSVSKIIKHLNESETVSLHLYMSSTFVQTETSLGWKSPDPSADNTSDYFKPVFFFFWHLSWFARQIVKLLLHTVPTHSCFEPRLHGEGTVIAVCLGRRNGAMTCHQQQQLRGCSLDTEMRRVKSPKTINPCTFIFFPREEQGERCCRTFHLWWFNILRRGMEAAALLLCNPPFCHSHFDFSLSWPCFEGKRRENTMVTWNWLQVAAQGSEVFPEKLVRSGKGNMFSKRTESRRVLFRPHW